jgi:hypothetical protein
MARVTNISTFECDCGHKSYFGIGTVRETEADSLHRRKTLHLLDSEREEHTIEFVKGRAVAVICPRLGRLEIAK